MELPMSKQYVMAAIRGDIAEALTRASETDGYRCVCFMGKNTEEMPDGSDSGLLFLLERDAPTIIVPTEAEKSAILAPSLDNPVRSLTLVKD
jgi:hypothetical protein